MRLICGDALRALAALPAESVDLVCTDPPYGQSNEAYDRGVDPAVWRETFRVAKPDAAILSFAGNPTYHRIASDIEAAGWQVRQMWAWVYRDGMITSAYPKEGFDRLAPSFDPIVYATKGKVLLNLEREGGAWKATRTFTGLSARSTGNTAATKAEGHWPRTITAEPGLYEFAYFFLPRTAGEYRKERTGHPNQKPAALMRWLLSKVPGAVVLDPFMGSGTTGAVCHEMGRDFIGVELNPDYYAIAAARLAHEGRAA